MAYSAEFKKIHDRTLKEVKKVWGKASEWQCVLCFDPAREWAFLWRTHNPSDPEGFVAMCRRDHVDYDEPGQSPEARARSSEISHDLWSDPGYRKWVSAEWKKKWEDPEYRERMSGQSRRMWEDQDYRAKMSDKLSESSKRLWQDPTFRAKMAEARRSTDRDPERRARMSETSRKRWQDPAMREKLMKGTTSGMSMSERAKLGHAARRARKDAGGRY